MRFEHLGTGHQVRSSNWGEGPSAKSEEATETTSPSTNEVNPFVVKKRSAEGRYAPVQALRPEDAAHRKHKSRSQSADQAIPGSVTIDGAATDDQKGQKRRESMRP